MFHDEWLDRLQSLIDTGVRIGPRGRGTREQLVQTLVLDSCFNLLDVPSRRMNYRFAVAEFIWMIMGRSDVACLARYNPMMNGFSDNGLWLAGAYGPHINGGYRRALTKLKEDPSTRQAVIQIPRPFVYFTKDEPCTLSFQFLIREDMLHCIVTMRSSDAWLGIPYDIYTFTQIQNCYAGELGLARGTMWLQMGSSHLYDDDEFNAKTVLEETRLVFRLANTIYTPPLPGRPPAWLEEVLVTQDPDEIPPLADPVWLPYARVLLSPTSSDAREILRENGQQSG